MITTDLLTLAKFYGGAVSALRKTQDRRFAKLIVSTPEDVIRVEPGSRVKDVDGNCYIVTDTGVVNLKNGRAPSVDSLPYPLEVYRVPHS
jgi:hypothetical protein